MHTNITSKNKKQAQQIKTNHLNKLKLAIAVQCNRLYECQSSRNLDDILNVNYSTGIVRK